MATSDNSDLVESLYRDIQCYAVQKIAFCETEQKRVDREMDLAKKVVTSTSSLIKTRIIRHPNFRQLQYDMINIRGFMRMKLFHNSAVNKSLEESLQHFKAIPTQFLLDCTPYMKWGPLTNTAAEEIKQLSKAYLPKSSERKRTTRIELNKLRNEMKTIICDQCKTANSFIEEDDHSVCKICALVSRDRIMTNPAYLHFEESTIQQIIPYKRLIYFREKLRQLQGKTKIKIPFVVTNSVIQHCVNNDIAFSDVTKDIVRTVLRSHGFVEYLEQTPAILQVVCPSLKPKEIPNELFDVLCTRFMELDRVFTREYIKHGIKAFNRKSMISIPLICKLTCEEHPKWQSFKFPWKITGSTKVLKSQMKVYKKLKKLL